MSDNVPTAPEQGTAGNRLARRAQRHGSQYSGLLAAFVLGAILMGVLVPDHATDVATTAGTADSTVDVTGPSGTADAGAAGDAGADEVPALGGAPGAGTPTTAALGPGQAPASGGSSGATVRPGGATAQGSSGAAPAAAAATSGNNGGATAQGVTATKIKVGVLDLDSSSLAPVCPRCGNGPASKGAATLGLIKAWERDGLLPINGRTIEPVFRITDILNPESNRNGCVAMAQEIKPLVVIANTGTQEAAACVAREFKLPVVGGTGRTENFIRPLLPYYVETKATPDRVYRNFAHWAQRNNLLTGKKVGLYLPQEDDAHSAAIQFKNEMRKLGVTAAAEVRASGCEATTCASDAVAVQQFRTAAVDVAYLFVSIAGFQNAAEGQAYRPKYPIAEIGDNFTDAVADIFYNVNAMDGNIGMNTKFWRWAQRKPAVPAGNDKAAYCLKAYQDFSKRTLDVFDNDAEVNYVMWACTTLEVLREALVKAGPNLTPQSVLNGLYSVRNFPTSFYPHFNLFPNRFGGGESMATFRFGRQRHQPENNYWRIEGDYSPFTHP